jgi:hypothetical protein
MMSDTSSNNASSMEARVIGERVQGAPGWSSQLRPKNGWVEDATTATAAAAGEAKSVLGEAAQQAWSQAGGVAEEVVDAGRRATKSVSRQIERPLMVALVGFALGYLASLWIHKEGGRPARIADDKANIKAPSP